jgi:hypothetical protein
MPGGASAPDAVVARGLGDDQGSLINARIGDRREQHERDDDYENLSHDGLLNRR